MTDVAIDIRLGMATIFWALAWADHVDGERHDCTNLSGVAIENVMPPIPEEAYALARTLCFGVESANGKFIERLYQEALEADIAAYGPGGAKEADSTPLRFGECLAYEAMGHGVGWDDDHAKVEWTLPHIENFELMLLAGDRCQREGRPRHVACGGYNDPDARKCEHCGRRFHRKAGTILRNEVKPE